VLHQEGQSSAVIVLGMAGNNILNFIEIFIHREHLHKLFAERSSYRIDESEFLLFYQVGIIA